MDYNKMNLFAEQLMEAIRKSFNMDIIINRNKELLEDDTVINEEFTISAYGKTSPPFSVILYYAEHSGEKSMDDIVDEIKTICQSHGVLDIPAEKFSDYEEIKNSIFPKLINKNANETLLEYIPYRTFLDLVVTFTLHYEIEKGKIATIQIYNDNLSHWNISSDQLLNLAMENMITYTPPIIANIVDLEEIRAKTPETVIPIPYQEFSETLTLDTTDEPCPLYGITNLKMIHGATALLYPKILNWFADQFKSDFFILPSSTHELIVGKTEHGLSLSELYDMVKEVNEEVVLKEVFLSDNVYLYLKSTKQILLYR